MSPLIAGEEPSRELHKEVKEWVRKGDWRHRDPGRDPLGRGLPKTRSGKIMRRILRKIATGETDSLGDISTLADRGRGQADPREVGSGVSLFPTSAEPATCRLCCLRDPDRAEFGGRQGLRANQANK